MTTLELKKMKMELVQVQAARAALEYRIEEHLDNIARIQDSIKAQLDKEAELTTKINQEQKT